MDAPQVVCSFKMKNIIIIGNSASGIAAVESIRKVDKDAKVLVISHEDYPAYQRCNLSHYLSGEIAQTQLLYRQEEFYKEHNIDLILGKKVIKVEPRKNRIILDDTQKLEYDQLLIATGASAKFPDTPGIHKRGIFGFWGIKDAKEILGLLPVTKTICVLGGGLIGLEVASGFKKIGMEVKLIVKSEQLLSQVVDKTAADILQRHLESNGLEILLGLEVVEFLGNGDLKAIKLNSGKVIGCELVIVAKGISPNIGIVKDTEIKVNAGIIVDKFFRTSVENIFASGDCAEAFDFIWERHRLNSSWANAVEQGSLAGKNLVGENLAYPGSMRMHSLEFFGLPIVSMGMIKEDEEVEVLSKFDEQNKVYKKLILKNNFINGAILLGNTENSSAYLELIKTRQDVTSLKEELFS